MGRPLGAVDARTREVEALMDAQVLLGRIEKALPQITRVLLVAQAKVREAAGIADRDGKRG